ncbi:MAG TPA: YbaB/EbfC family nucleoid-associated protein [Actinoplanes sp.]|nr:YbaB/EbfC family nucleoid-associated protein [Actinoplanes sp.]
MALSQEQLAKLREQSQIFQDQMADIQNTLMRTEVTGSAADGNVSVRMTAGGEFLAVHLDPALVEDCDAGELESLMLSALRDASHQLHERATERAGSLNSMLDALRDR